MLNNLKPSNNWQNTNEESNKMIQRMKELERKCKILSKKTKVLVSKSEAPSRISDFLRIKFPNSAMSSTITKEDWLQIINNLKLTGKKYKNLCKKILHLVIKWEMPKKISDYLLVLFLNWTMSSKSPAINSRKLREELIN